MIAEKYEPEKRTKVSLFEALMKIYILNINICCSEAPPDSNIGSADIFTRRYP